MGCMNPLPDGRPGCGICGYPADGENPAPYLPVRAVLSDRYIVGRVLESTGDAAVYMGYDQVQKAPILIREFLPNTLCERTEGGAVRIIPGCENAFRDYHEKFCNHARALARMRDLPAVILLYDIFRQNETSYTISEYVEGITLETRLAQAGGRLRWEEARPLFMPLLSSLISLHAAGILHLGVTPTNLIIGTDGRLRLTNFAIAEARKVSTDLKPQLSDGYSAPEQYAFDGACDAQTDVYGLAATVFRTLTGNPPPPAARRNPVGSDLFVPADVARELPDHVAAALFNALQVQPEKRTASVAAFRDQLSAAPAVTELLREEKEAVRPAPPVHIEEKEAEEKKPPEKKGMSRGKIAALIVAAVFILLLLVAFAVLLVVFPEIFTGKPSASNTSTPFPSFLESSGSASSQGVNGDLFAVDSVVGKNYFDIKESTFNGSMKLEVAAKQYSDKPKGEILSQDPSPENLREKGATIRVVISDGPEERTLPDLSGWEEENAKLLLEAMGFRVDVQKLVMSDYDKGQVQETSPAAGEKAAEGDTIVLRVSDQEHTTAPPDTTTTENPFDPTTTAPKPWWER